MKKIMMLLLAATMMIALSACGGSNNGADNAEPAADANAQQVNLTATNFQFDQAEYRVKAGQPVTFTLNSKEGVHGAEIKDLDVNLSPDKKTQTITPDKPGTYEIACSIPCGSGHANMKSKLIVE